MWAAPQYFLQSYFALDFSTVGTVCSGIMAVLIGGGMEIVEAVIEVVEVVEAVILVVPSPLLSAI